jgi:hypothetical protein
MSDQHDKRFPSFFQGMVDSAVARSRTERQAEVERLEAEVERLTAEVERLEAEVEWRVEAEAERRVEAGGRPSRGPGEVTKAAIRAAAAVFNDLGTPSFPTTETAFAAAIAAKAQALEGIELSPKSGSVRMVAKAMQAGVKRAEKAEQEGANGRDFPGRSRPKSP